MVCSLGEAFKKGQCLFVIKTIGYFSISFVFYCNVERKPLARRVRLERKALAKEEASDYRCSTHKYKVLARHMPGGKIGYKAESGSGG